MYKNNIILCVIPARGGSKGLPGKNVRKILGKPLISYSIEQANESRYIDRIIVSTDDKEISEIAKQSGGEILFSRPDELASDESGIIDVLLHAIEWMEKKEGYSFDILVLLHATTPLRCVEDIDNSIEMLVNKKADNVFSVTEAHKNPYFNMIEINKDGTAKLVKKGNFVTRQAAPLVYDMNASVYVWWKNKLKEKKRHFMEKSYVYIMPKERSIDIDDYFDFMIAELLLKKNVSIDNKTGDINTKKG